jgi:hypothetical protein
MGYVSPSIPKTRNRQFFRHPREQSLWFGIPRQAGQYVFLDAIDRFHVAEYVLPLGVELPGLERQDERAVSRAQR